jgi:cytochrome b5
MSESEGFPLVKVAKHQSRDDAWLVINGKVMDVTRFLADHPGGEDIMLDSAGRDASREFEEVGHSGDARAKLQDLCIGSLRDATADEIRLASVIVDGKSGGDPAAVIGLRSGLYTSGAKLWSIGVSSSSSITAARAGLAAGAVLITAVIVQRLVARNSS